MRGDIGIVRSGPEDSSFAEEFSKAELVKAVEFYRTNDRGEVFGEREMSRVMRKCGGGGGVRPVHAHWHF